jgi:hypothetical protein
MSVTSAIYFEEFIDIFFKLKYQPIDVACIHIFISISNKYRMSQK